MNIVSKMSVVISVIIFGVTTLNAMESGGWSQKDACPPVKGTILSKDLKEDQKEWESNAFKFYRMMAKGENANRLIVNCLQCSKYYAATKQAVNDAILDENFTDDSQNQAMLERKGLGQTLENNRNVCDELYKDTLIKKKQEDDNLYRQGNSQIAQMDYNLDYGNALKGVEEFEKREENQEECCKLRR